MTHRVHLDYASSAPLRPFVREAMTISAGGEPYDPRRLYDDAITARYEIETSREKVAAFFGCDPSEVIFTSSSSESLAMFAHGVIDGSDAQINVFPHVVTTALDSEVIHTTWLNEKADVSFVTLDDDGIIDLEQLKTVITKDTKAISIAYAHPDTGTIQPLEQIVTLIRLCNAETLIHLDARFASGYAPLNFHALGIDAMTVECSTFGGPTGIDALILRRGLLLNPLLAGGTQERARRTGIENTVGIAGFGALCEVAQKTLGAEIESYKKIHTTVASILEEHGARFITPKNIDTLPHMISAILPGVAASAVVAEFNRHQINIHAGSSCGSEEFEPSPSLIAIGLDETEAESVFRISWGFNTSNDDIEQFDQALSRIVTSLVS